MAIEYSHGKKTASAKTKVTAAAFLGALTSVIAGTLTPWYVALLVGWDIAALIFLFWVWLSVWYMDSKLTASHALREDPSRAASDVFVLLASIASLVAVAVVLANSSKESSTQVLNIAFAVASVIISWLSVHTVFALRYAEAYYKGSVGGAKFEGENDPAYADFAYLAYTIGMTFQVSDTTFTSRNFRIMALRHSLISYIFGTIIVATTINLIAGLIK